MRKFVQNFRANLKLAGAPHDDATVWRILRRIQILVFDFNQEGSSTQILVRDRCSMLLAPEEVSKSNALWQTLVTLALESAAKGGEKTLAEIRERLVNEYHYRFAGDRQLANARAALQEASFGALQVYLSRLVPSISTVPGTSQTFTLRWTRAATSRSGAGRVSASRPF